MIIVIFRIGSQKYGLPVEFVMEVVRLPDLLALADAPPSICGLLNLRGNYLPVLHGRVLLQETLHYDINEQIIIIGQEQAEFGLLVDEVRHVIALPVSTQISLSGNKAAAFLKGVITTDYGSVLLLEPLVLQDLVPTVHA
ncbi:MAG: chemotaxis protein CheW [Chloroflexaceae bacterium]|nr:chemotaxis protein CheW [Chloroflexaceae bacterium]